MGDARDTPILIAGPTTSGKSALALRLAEQHGGVVINADSMQVYSELRILTARPSAEDEACAPHWLYGHVPARNAYSAGQFLKDIAGALDQATRDRKRPIIVGGTGLYFKVLTEGIAPVPDIHPDIRRHWRAQAEEHGAYGLWQMLTERDPEMAAQLDPNDTQRIVRAHEVMTATGKSLAAWKHETAPPLIDPKKTERFVLMADRSVLQNRAAVRFQQMIERGALAEAQHLGALQLAPDLPVMRAIGVRPLIASSRGECTIDEAIAAATQETAAYIKRQQTWIKKYMISWNAIVAQ